MAAIKSSASKLLLKEKSAIDHMMVGVAFISPLTALPQVYEIFVNQQASGVSLVSWIMYLCLGLISLSYGLVHKLRPIIITQLLWSIMDILIIVGIVMYGSGRKPRISYDTLLILNNTGKLLTVVSLILVIPASYFYFKAYIQKS